MNTVLETKEAPAKTGQSGSITITQPDDMHLHLRDGRMMEEVLPYSARVFGRAIIMPNLKPPVTTVAVAAEYHARIKDVLFHRCYDFEPLMTLYLTDNTTPEEIRRAAGSGFIHGVKYYPAGATTNSTAGVTGIEKCYAALEEMQKLGMPLLLHGEATDPDVDVFDREAVFIEKVFVSLRARFPALKMVLEHISTEQGVEMVEDEHSQGNPTGATITVQHMLDNRNSLFRGGMRSHLFCYPILKTERDRRAVLAAATSGHPKFFLGTDSAPHPKEDKECACASGGCFTAPHALALYAHAFDSAGALDKLEGFASHHGADFYGLPRNKGTVTLVPSLAHIPEEVDGGASVIVPYRAGQGVRWVVSKN